MSRALITTCSLSKVMNPNEYPSPKEWKLGSLVSRRGYRHLKFGHLDLKSLEIAKLTILKLYEQRT